MHANMSPHSLFFSRAILILWGFGISDGRAEFALNFQKNPGGTVIYGMECNINGLGACASWTSADSVTPFLQETVFDGTTSYWHVIVGDPATGFAQETYIRMWGSQDSASGPTDANIPLTGPANGSGNPNRVQMRQVLGTPGAEHYEEFRKDFYTKKPKITQTMNTPEIDSQFVFDMSNIDYSTSGTAGTITSTFNILDPSVPGDFDMATDKQASTITGGMYTYTNGAGNHGSGGTYNYMEGDFNLLGIDWSAFKNP